MRIFGKFYFQYCWPESFWCRWWISWLEDESFWREGKWCESWCSTRFGRTNDLKHQRFNNHSFFMYKNGYSRFTVNFMCHILIQETNDCLVIWRSMFSWLKWTMGSTLSFLEANNLKTIFIVFSFILI